MSLTVGRGPFSEQGESEFNFDRSPERAVLLWEPCPKRVRVELGDEIVADSREVRALHETGHLMRLYFPRKDVQLQRLEPSDRTTTCPHKGDARYWTVRVGEAEAVDAAWSYENPVQSAAFMAGYISFQFDAMDAWYQEDERIYAHPRDPYHRFDIHRSSRSVRVRLNGELVAESSRPAVLFETSLPPRYYLPPEDVQTQWLEVSTRLTHCPYKGSARHWHLEAGGQRVRNAAWTLEEPLGEAASIAGWYCFYNNKAQVEVDGERLEEPG